MNRIAIIGSGPTGIYTLKGLISSVQPLLITIFEETADAGKGTPYHPAGNDRVMLANIASIEIPPIEQSLVAWLRCQTPDRLEELGIGQQDIGEREFYPRVVIGEYLADQFWMVVRRGQAAGHTINVKASHRILDIKLNEADIGLVFKTRGSEAEGRAAFDHVVMATGHDWPENTEIAPGYFSSPWPAAAIKRIGDVEVGVLGTSLSGIDAVMSVATAHGLFLRDDAGTLTYRPDGCSNDFRLTMMSRKGLLPEADFYCSIPYTPLQICTEDAIRALIVDKPDRLLDEIFDLFKREIVHADLEYAARIGLALATMEDFADRYFRARQEADPFVWAARNLAEAKQNKESRTTVQWRYTILRMHEVIALAAPHFTVNDLERFHKHFKPVFVDDYATVPHESVERLLALHATDRLRVIALGDDYEIMRHPGARGAVVKTADTKITFAAFIDATGQNALSASDLPFPSLKQAGALKKAQTKTIDVTGEEAHKRTGGIDIDDEFPPRVDGRFSNKLYCVSIPFLLHKLPFVQGITSVHEMALKVSAAIRSSLDGKTMIIGDVRTKEGSSPTDTVPFRGTAA